MNLSPAVGMGHNLCTMVELLLNDYNHFYTQSKISAPESSVEDAECPCQIGHWAFKALDTELEDIQTGLAH